MTPIWIPQGLIDAVDEDDEPARFMLMRRLWARPPPAGNEFGELQDMCARWADSFERDYAAVDRGLDPGLAREGIALLRELPRSAERSVLLSTDLHAGNVLAAQREPWLVIDPKPFVGDPAYDAQESLEDPTMREPARRLAPRR